MHTSTWFWRVEWVLWNLQLTDKYVHIGICKESHHKEKTTLQYIIENHSLQEKDNFKPKPLGAKSRLTFDACYFQINIVTDQIFPNLYIVTDRIQPGITPAVAARDMWVAPSLPSPATPATHGSTSPALRCPHLPSLYIIPDQLSVSYCPLKQSFPWYSTCHFSGGLGGSWEAGRH